MYPKNLISYSAPGLGSNFLKKGQNRCALPALQYRMYVTVDQGGYKEMSSILADQ